MDNSILKIFDNSIEDDIRSVVQFIFIKIFVSFDISEELILDRKYVFDLINELLIENYGYSLNFYTNSVLIFKIFQEEASNHGIKLTFL